MWTPLIELTERYAAARSAGRSGEDDTGMPPPLDPADDPLIQALIELHLVWLEARADVWDAYADWREAPSAFRAEAQAAYVTVLDREERAATDLQTVVEQLWERLEDGEVIDAAGTT
jgi:hypothetical protein